MHVLFLGTGAADRPAPCATSPDGEQSAVRGYSSVLIDRRILIDCGSTTPSAIKRFGVDPAGISDILLTHTHRDHFDGDAVGHVASLRTGEDAMSLWAHPSALSTLPHIDGVRRCPAEVGQTFAVASLTATGLAANHPCGRETPLHYLIEKRGSTLLYATDGSWFLNSTWLYLKEHVLDAIVWDATCGESQGNWRIFSHNSVDMIRLMRQTLEREGVLPAHGRIFLTHMARILCASHTDMTETLAPEGLIPAHDGLEISICGAEPSIPGDA